MKRIFLLLVSCFVLFLLIVPATAQQAPQAQWWKCTSTYKGKSVSHKSCATSAYMAGANAGASGMCGPGSVVPTKEQKACFDAAVCKKTHEKCVP